MKILKITHPLGTPAIHPIPDPDKFAEEIMSPRNLRALDRNTKIGAFQKADYHSSSDGFYLLSDFVLVFTRAVYDSEMGRLLDFSGNVHPCTLQDTGESLYFLNVTAVYNCLDVAETTFSTGRSQEKGVDHGLGMTAYAFFPKLIGDSKLFRIPQSLSIFAASDGSSDDFYGAYQNAGLGGLSFTEVWSDE
jgi:hypothetical protein